MGLGGGGCHSKGRVGSPPQCHMRMSEVRLVTNQSIQMRYGRWE